MKQARCRLWQWTVSVVSITLLMCTLWPFGVAASELLEVLPLTDQVVMLHFTEGHVIHHQRGQRRSEENVELSALEVAAATNLSSYALSSSDDARYHQKRSPVRVGRKSKGTDFACYDPGRCVSGSFSEGRPRALSQPKRPCPGKALYGLHTSGSPQPEAHSWWPFAWTWLGSKIPRASIGLERPLKPMPGRSKFVYALGGGKAQSDGKLQQTIRAAVLATADTVALEVPPKRALRWGGNWYMPMLVGQQTTPWMLPAAVGYTLTRSAMPAKAERYLAALYTTCDYFLGCNALHMTWITGLRPRHPRQVFHNRSLFKG